METNWIEASAGLVFREGKVLIAQRRTKDHLGGLWEFPGGKKEKGETDEECLKRELREELGIEVAVGELLETVSHPYKTKAVRIKFFKCAWQSNEPQALECADLAWVNAQQLKNYEFPEADVRLLQVLQQTPKLWE